MGFFARTINFHLRKGSISISNGKVIGDALAQTQWVRACMVEANQKENNECPQLEAAGFDSIEPDRFPVILKEGPNTLTSTYYVGKRILKDNYFGQAAIVFE